MEDDNSVVIDIGSGWFDQLLTEIDRNKAFLKQLIADFGEHTREDYAIAMNMKARNDRIKTKLMLSSTPEGYAVIDKADYQDILLILLENAATFPHDLEVQYE